MKFNKETNSSIGVSTGMTKLAGGAVTTPLAYVDMKLPADFVGFTLQTFALGAFSDTLAVAFSFDGGATFVNDPTHDDSYVTIELFMDDTGGTGFAGNFNGPTGLTQIGGSNGDDATHSYTISIVPGDDTHLPYYYDTGVSLGYDIPDATAFIQAHYINPAATITTAPARANLIRLLPSGNHDCNPPTSGETFTTGSYILWGIKP